MFRIQLFPASCLFSGWPLPTNEKKIKLDMDNLKLLDVVLEGKLVDKKNKLAVWDCKRKLLLWKGN
jgi:hypothetical protein